MGSGDADTIVARDFRSGVGKCFLDGNSFASCTGGSGQVELRRCDAGTPCGDGYVCSRFKQAAAGNGICTPPYFTASLQIFGHRLTK